MNKKTIVILSVIAAAVLAGCGPKIPETNDLNAQTKQQAKTPDGSQAPAGGAQVPEK